jgi:uncharacterized protein YccT (UPF0319 family)
MAIGTNEHQIVFRVASTIGEENYVMLFENAALNPGVEFVRRD